jgi:hypothetical protein
VEVTGAKLEYLRIGNMPELFLTNLFILMRASLWLKNVYGEFRYEFSW